MKAETCALPIQCSRCGELFDLSYDIARERSRLDVEEVVRAVRARLAYKQMLCWHCRN